MSRKDSRGYVLQKGESERISNGKRLGYVYRYRDAAGVQCQIYAKTLNELRKKEKDITANQVLGVKREGEKLTLQQVAELWLETRRRDVPKRLRQTTLDGYTYSWHRYFEVSRLAKSKVSAITSENIEDHYRDMLDSGSSVGTAETAHVVLSGVFKWALKRGLCADNPSVGALTTLAKDTRKQEEAANGKRIRCLDKESRTYLLKVLDAPTSPTLRHYGPIIRLLLHTGLRIGELCGLTFEDVDADVIRVRHCLKYCSDDKGHMHFVANSPKSGTSRRDIALSKSAKADLAEWFALGRKCTAEPCGLKNLVFCTPKGTALTYRAVNLVLSSLVSKGGGALPQGLTCHWLRHCFVSDAIDAGMPVTAVSQYVGHKDTKVTLNVYYACRPHVMAEGLAILDTIDAPESKQTSKQKEGEFREGRNGFRLVS